MTINGIKIRKYRARVKAQNDATTSPKPVSADGYSIVEGYVSISAVIMPYDEKTPRFVPIFVAEEVDFHRMAMSGFGKSVFHPKTYAEGEFEILGEVE